MSQELNQFQKDVLAGACVSCGKFRHIEYENLSIEQLNLEIDRLGKMDIYAIIDTYGDQQGNFAKILCISHELNKRKLKVTP